MKLDAIPYDATQDEDAAVAFLERVRWGEHPRCPRCESANVYQMAAAVRTWKPRRFLWRCRDCKRMYTVRIGTVMEDSKAPCRHWCLAWWMLSSKRGCSALEVKRRTGLGYESALFLHGRILWALRDNGGDLLRTPEPKVSVYRAHIASEDAWVAAALAAFPDIRLDHPYVNAIGARRVAKDPCLICGGAMLGKRTTHQVCRWRLRCEVRLRKGDAELLEWSAPTKETTWLKIARNRLRDAKVAVRSAQKSLREESEPESNSPS